MCQCYRAGDVLIFTTIVPFRRVIVQYEMYVCVALLLFPAVVCRPQGGHEQEKVGFGLKGSQLAQRPVAERRTNEFPEYQSKGFLDCCMNNLKPQGVPEKCINYLCKYINGELSCRRG
jgi:hypothetical protein